MLDMKEWRRERQDTQIWIVGKVARWEVINKTREGNNFDANLPTIYSLESISSLLAPTAVAKIAIRPKLTNRDTQQTYPGRHHHLAKATNYRHCSMERSLQASWGSGVLSPERPQKLCLCWLRLTGLMKSTPVITSRPRGSKLEIEILGIWRIRSKRRKRSFYCFCSWTPRAEPSSETFRLSDERRRKRSTWSIIKMSGCSFRPLPIW